MTPETARLQAQAILADHASVNASYIANGVIARAAELAAIVIDLADQLDAAQTELVTVKRELHESRKEAVSDVQVRGLGDELPAGVGSPVRALRSDAPEGTSMT